jgi:hypothetical protein
MNRRAFVAGSLGAAALPSAGLTDSPDGGHQDATSARPQVFELRRYRLAFGPMEARFAEHAKGALVPALDRAGIKPVGAFTVALGPDIPTVYLLVPHPSIDSVATLDARLEADAEYKRAAASFLGLGAAEPPFVRVDSSLMTAFERFPGIEAPKGPLAAPSRIFELRTYESHSDAAGRKKVEMFEKAGEIEIFRRVGLTPVFFARDLVGPRLPSLTYMLVFADAAAREKGWATFRDDAEWVKLRSTAGFTNAEILTNIQSTLLRPTDYSQL